MTKEGDRPWCLSPETPLKCNDVLAMPLDEFDSQKGNGVQPRAVDFTMYNVCSLDILHVHGIVHVLRRKGVVWRAGFWLSQGSEYRRRNAWT